MQDMEMKQKVLKEIMGLMDEKDGDKLKSHPKLMAAKIEVEKPEEDVQHVVAEEKAGLQDEGGEEMTPEVIQKLLEMYKDMK